VDTPIDLYLSLMKRVLTNEIYQGAPILWFDDDPNNPAAQAPEWEKSARWPNVAHTLVPPVRLDNVRFCLETVIADGIPGDFIETGVWRGGVCIFARAVLRAHGVDDRTVWVADSFEGVPVPGDDGHPDDIALGLHKNNHLLAITADEVRDNFRRYGQLDDRVTFLSGWFADTLPTAPISSLAVLRLDGDLHSSTMDGLTHLYPKVAPGGFVIVDDYGIPGCATAVHEFRDRHDITDKLVNIDPWSVYWRRELD
jgi:hypothetical protein